MLKKFLVSGCIVLFREHALVQCTLTLVTLLAFLCLALGICPFLNRLISGLCSLGEVRFRPLQRSAPDEVGMPNRWLTPTARCATAQVAAVLTLASGMPFLLPDSTLGKLHSDDLFRLRFGFGLLQWIVLIVIPVFLVVGLGLASYEVYYELSTTSGKGKRFQKLVAALRLPGARRTLEDITSIYAAIVTSEFLKPYPYSKLAMICRKCELLELEPHEAVFSEGDAGDRFFVLIKGTVDVYVKEKTPPLTEKCVNTLREGASFGELALLQVTHAPAVDRSARLARWKKCRLKMPAVLPKLAGPCRNQESAARLSSPRLRPC